MPLFIMLLLLLLLPSLLLLLVVPEEVLPAVPGTLDLFGPVLLPCRDDDDEEEPPRFRLLLLLPPFCEFRTVCRTGLQAGQF